jgi:SAM-dependent methyltransferase
MTPSPAQLTEHAIINRDSWGNQVEWYREAGEALWALDEPSWGIWGIPEPQVGMFGDQSRLPGMDVVELGCGTAYVSAWLARRGAKPVGIDITPGQLESARAFQAKYGLDFPLIEGSAEALPFEDGRFDLAISEYGACLWCDPDLWIPEAARVLRPGGELVFLTNSPLLMMCTPDTATTEDAAGTELVRDQFGMRSIEWADDDPGVEFHLAHGEMIATLRRHGFEVTELRELQVPEDATSRYAFVTHDWARRWPCEELWRARRT